MKNKKILLTFSLPFLLPIISGCNTQNEEEHSGRQTKEQVEVFESNYGNTRVYNEDYFNNPNNVYRVMPVNHASALSSGGASTSKFDEYMSLGYGGVVTNVALGDEYLVSDSNWEMMEEAITYGIEKLDMRVMLYDEEYYPSGAARQLTLAAEPEGENWQAQGLVYGEHILKANQPVTLESRHGHQLIHAYVYKEGNLNSINPTNAVDVLKDVGEGNQYTPTEDGLLVLLYSKNWYEGTHYQNNLMESRHYIDLMKAEPVQEFINNTYERYYDHFAKYFGNSIEGFFFDEPSLPGMYFTPTTPTVLDPIDGQIDQFPAVNFDDKICQKFKEKYGYDPSPYLPYLFEKSNSNPEIRRFRWKYYQLISELVENNWAGQLDTWCDNHSVVSTGHFLAEEDIADHPLMLGNYMNSYHRMGMPGIDMTHGSAIDAISIGANVAKQATSVADFDGKQHVFCEIGQDEAMGANVYDNIANVATLQCMGIDYLVSYYHLATDDDTTLLANSLARINYMLDGNTAEKNVAVYYPIEGIYSSETPYNANGQRIYTGSWGFNQYVSEISNNYRSLLQGFVKNQIDYNIFNEYMILNSEIKDGALVTPNGETFTTLIIPFTNAMNYDVMQKLKQAANGGVNIVLQNISSLLCLDENNQKALTEDLDTLKNQETVHALNNVSLNNMLLELNKIPETKLVNLQNSNGNIVARKQNNGDNTLYMLVNTSPKPQTVTIVADEVGTEYNSWDVYTGEVNGMCVTVKDGKSYLTVKLPAYNVGIYTIGGNK